MTSSPLAEENLSVTEAPQETLLAEQLVEFANEAFVFGASSKNSGAKTAQSAVLKPENYFADVTPPKLSPWHLKNTRVLPSREEMLHQLPKGGVSVEVGAGKGLLSRQILFAVEPSKLHICDHDFHSFDDRPFAAAFEKGTVEFHEGDPAEFLAGLPDHHLSLVFLHLGPSYTAAARALEQAGRKLKEDGQIICANYTAYSPIEGVKYGVARAVNEFCHINGFEVSHLALDALGYQDAALRKCATERPSGVCLDVPDTNSFLPDIWEHLIGKYDISSVLDIGACAGWSTKWFVDRGIYTLGVESWREALERSRCRANVIEHDYRYGPFIPSMVLDLAWCAGFVEQIEEEYIVNFMSSFRTCRFVCLTHAEPGQSGPHFVNCQPTEYWIDKMDTYGFDFDADETAYLRSTDTYKAPSGRRTLTFFKTRT